MGHLCVSFSIHILKTTAFMHQCTVQGTAFPLVGRRASLSGCVRYRLKANSSFAFDYIFCGWLVLLPVDALVVDGWCHTHCSGLCSVSNANCSKQGNFGCWLGIHCRPFPAPPSPPHTNTPSQYPPIPAHPPFPNKV